MKEIEPQENGKAAEPDSGPQAEPDFAAPSRLNRWSDCMNPLLVKELRQGRRSGWLFVSLALSAVG